MPAKLSGGGTRYSVSVYTKVYCTVQYRVGYTVGVGTVVFRKFL